MSRILLALCLWLSSAAAFAASTIIVSTTYTPAANAYVNSVYGTTGDAGIRTAVETQIANANAAYAASGINVTLVSGSVVPASRPMSDTASMGAQLYWAQHDVNEAQYRVWAGPPDGPAYGADVQMHINDPGASASTSAVVPSSALGPNPTTQSAVGVVPIRGMINTNKGLELAISKIISGGSAGYATRQNRYSYETDPTGATYGNTFCAHTREASPTVESTPVQDLSPVYFTNYIPGNAWQYTLAPTAYISCQSFLNTMRNYFSCNTHHCATAAVTGAAPGVCTVSNDGTNGETAGNPSFTPSLVVNTSSGSHPITCTDIADNRYSSPTLYLNGKPLGDSSHNTVAAMNARAPTIANLKSGSASLLAHAKGAIAQIVAFWNSLGS